MVGFEPTLGAVRHRSLARTATTDFGQARQVLDTPGASVLSLPHHLCEKRK